MWPYNEDDHMELGSTGWVSIGEGMYFNKHNNHTIDELGREYDASGILIYDPENE